VGMNPAADENQLELFRYANIQILTTGIYAK
jgi:hypothetical protein